MVKGIVTGDKHDRFATPPWSIASLEWQMIDQHLPADHLARRIAQAVDRLDLSPLWESYLGVGKKALPPDLLLKLVLYEMQNKRPSPAQWTKDARENDRTSAAASGAAPKKSASRDTGWSTLCSSFRSSSATAAISRKNAHRLPSVLAS